MPYWGPREETNGHTNPAIWGSLKQGGDKWPQNPCNIGFYKGGGDNWRHTSTHESIHTSAYVAEIIVTTVPQSSPFCIGDIKIAFQMAPASIPSICECITGGSGFTQGLALIPGISEVSRHSIAFIGREVLFLAFKRNCKRCMKGRVGWAVGDLFSP